MPSQHSMNEIEHSCATRVLNECLLNGKEMNESTKLLRVLSRDKYCIFNKYIISNMLTVRLSREEADGIRNVK